MKKKKKNNKIKQIKNKKTVQNTVFLFLITSKKKPEFTQAQIIDIGGDKLKTCLNICYINSYYKYNYFV